MPALLYLGLDIKYAIGISVVQMAFSSVFGSFLNYKKGSLELKNSFFIGIGGFFGALNSGYLVNALSSQSLSFIFLSFVILAIYRFFKAPQISEKDEINNKLLLLLIGFFVGILSISVGIGGALLLTPIMVCFLHFDLKKAVSTALFFVIFSSVSGVISLSYYGFVDLTHGVLVGAMSLIGVYFGINLAHKTDPKRYKKLILVLNVVILTMMIIKLFNLEII